MPEPLTITVLSQWHVAISCLPRRLADVLKTSSQDILEDEKLWHGRRILDIFKISSSRLHQEECLLEITFLSSVTKLIVVK